VAAASEPTCNRGNSERHRCRRREGNQRRNRLDGVIGKKEAASPEVVAERPEKHGKGRAEQERGGEDGAYGHRRPVERVEIKREIHH